MKSIASVYGQGLKDFIIQRVTAIIMAVYMIALIAYLIFQTSISFPQWHFLFSQNWMKVATILFILSVLYHAWIGMWTIFTDYVKVFSVRIILNFLVLLVLFACFFWGILILWGN